LVGLIPVRFQQMRNLSNRGFLNALVLIASAGILVAGLWPFDFHASNQVVVAKGGRGLVFGSSPENHSSSYGGIIFNRHPIRCDGPTACTAGELTLEIQLRAFTDKPGCVQRIIEVRRQNGAAVFRIGQWRYFLMVSALGDDDSRGNAAMEVGIPNALVAGTARFVTISSNREGTTTYLDGRPVDNYPGLCLLKPGETIAGRIMYLGNTPGLECPWSGEIMAFSVYGHALPAGEVAAKAGLKASGVSADFESNGRKALAYYRFEPPTGELLPDLSGSGNHLRIPARLIFDKKALQSSSFSQLTISDAALNLFGFIPFGSLVALWLQSRVGGHAGKSAIVALCVGITLSLCIELLQAYLPDRDSSMADLVMNAIGTGIGTIGAMVAGGKSRLNLH
jgi:hypothetical protein